jgi:Helix-turn-helix domain
MDNFDDALPKDDLHKKGAVSDTAPSELTKLLNSNDTTASNQRTICLRVLAISPQSTIDLRHTYGVMMPAARIKELRNLGHDIATVRVTQTTPDKISHKRVAKYVLRHSPPLTNNQPSDKDSGVTL